MKERIKDPEKRELFTEMFKIFSKRCAFAICSDLPKNALCFLDKNPFFTKHENHALSDRIHSVWIVTEFNERSNYFFPARLWTHRASRWHFTERSNSMWELKLKQLMKNNYFTWNSYFYGRKDSLRVKPEITNNVNSSPGWPQMVVTRLNRRSVCKGLYYAVKTHVKIFLLNTHNLKQFNRCIL